MVAVLGRLGDDQVDRVLQPSHSNLSPGAPADRVQERPLTALFEDTLEGDDLGRAHRVVDDHRETDAPGSLARRHCGGGAERARRRIRIVGEGGEGEEGQGEGREGFAHGSGR